MGMKGTIESPHYRKVVQHREGTPTFLIICDEGWRESIVCGGMYGWQADWLVDQLQGKPYAKPPSRTVLDAHRMVRPGDEVLA